MGERRKPRLNCRNRSRILRRSPQRGSRVASILPFIRPRSDFDDRMTLRPWRLFDAAYFARFQDSRKAFMRSSPGASLLPPRKPDATQFGSVKSGRPRSAERQNAIGRLRRDADSAGHG